MKEDKDHNERRLEQYHKLHEHRVRYGKTSEKIRSRIGKLLGRILEARKKGKGFMNKENGLFNYHEWHAAGWGALLMFLYFRLEQGVFLVLFVTGIVKVWRDCHNECKANGGGLSYFYSEIGKNLHYYVLAGVLVAEIFVWTGATPPSVEKGLIAAVLNLLGL